MIDKTIPVDVEWALQGKTLGRAGVRVLACSDGTLSKENFIELIGRFNLGTPDKLPQVSVSYLTSGTTPGRTYYLGMAIHKWAADVRTDGGELLERDDDNRPVAVTAYFCVPYQPLANAAVSYQAMYQEFDKIRLGTTDGPPLPVEFPIRTTLPPIDELAMQSAGLLLTGRPVCVLGAESATMAERLDFIGAVATLLPYGFRTRLSAATWVRPTHRDHRFRLFFSVTARDADPPDHVVHWGRSEEMALTPDHDYAWEYGWWLTDTVGQLGVLAGLTTPRSFHRDDVLKSLDEIGVGPAQQAEKQAEKRAEEAPGEPLQKRRDPPRKSRVTRRDIGQTLHNCADYLKAENVSDLTVAITHLEARAKHRVSDEELERYQNIIKERSLFHYYPSISSTVERLRDALFKVAFKSALSYQDYCLIEDSVSPEPLDHALLQMIAGTQKADLQISSVVYAQLPPEVQRSWHKSAEVTGDGLVSVVASKWLRPRHAFFASVVAANYMSLRSCDSSLVREMLQRQGYLTRLLKDGSDSDHDQVFVLYYFLKSAYPRGFSKSDIRQILIGNTEPPSPVLLAAILRHLATPDKAGLALEAQLEYSSRVTLRLDLDEKTHNSLKSCLTYANGWPKGWTEPPLSQDRDQSGPGS